MNKMNVFKSTSKFLDVSKLNLIKHCMNKDNKYFGNMIETFDFVDDNKITFKSNNGVKYTIIIKSVKLSYGVKFHYTLYESYCCNDCNKEYLMDVDNGWTRCDECASHY